VYDNVVTCGTAGGLTGAAGIRSVLCMIIVRVACDRGIGMTCSNY